MKKRFDIDRLDEQSKLSYILYEFSAKDDLASHKFSENEYVFQHMSGPHSDLPSFLINVYAKLISAARNVITGAPFDSGENSPLMADFKSKIDATDIGPVDKQQLIKRAEAALTNSVGPAYSSLEN